MLKKLTKTQTKLIRRILSVEYKGLGVGVVGRDFCEFCGKADNFHGWIYAWQSHGAGGRFLCNVCLRTLEGTGGLVPAEKLDELIKNRGSRFCNDCGKETQIDRKKKDTVRKCPFYCKKCSKKKRHICSKERYLRWYAQENGSLKLFLQDTKEMKATLKDWFERPQQRVWIGYFKDKKYGNGWRIVKAETIKPPYQAWDKVFKTREAAVRFVFKKDWGLDAEPRNSE